MPPEHLAGSVKADRPAVLQVVLMLHLARQHRVSAAIARAAIAKPGPEPQMKRYQSVEAGISASVDVTNRYSSDSSESFLSDPESFAGQTPGKRETLAAIDTDVFDRVWRSRSYI